VEAFFEEDIPINFGPIYLKGVFQIYNTSENTEINFTEDCLYLRGEGKDSEIIINKISNSEECKLQKEIKLPEPKLQLNFSNELIKRLNFYKKKGLTKIVILADSESLFMHPRHNYSTENDFSERIGSSNEVYTLKFSIDDFHLPIDNYTLHIFDSKIIKFESENLDLSLVTVVDEIIYFNNFKYFNLTIEK